MQCRNIKNFSLKENLSIWYRKGTLNCHSEVLNYLVASVGTNTKSPKFLTSITTRAIFLKLSMVLRKWDDFKDSVVYCSDILFSVAV